MKTTLSDKIRMAAGSREVTVREIAAMAQITPAQASVWFFTTGKKEFKKVAPGKYIAIPGKDENHPLTEKLEALAGKKKPVIDFGISQFTRDGQTIGIRTALKIWNDGSGDWSEKAYREMSKQSMRPKNIANENVKNPIVKMDKPVLKILPSGQSAFLDIEEHSEVETRAEFVKFIETTNYRQLEMMDIPRRTIENWKYGHRYPPPWAMKMLMGI